MRSAKKYLLILAPCFLSLSIVAQKQLNTWYFGTKVGLNFNTTPPQVLTNGNANSVEGCSTMSDWNGNLLFYTNGLKIVNKQHAIMQNGDGLLGDLSSTSNTVIVPQSGNDSIYYVFTIGSTNQGTKGLRYSIVDIKMNGGLGAVTQKNVPVTDAEDLFFEKMAAVRHCNKKDVWITVRRWGSDEYYTYLLTSTGVNPAPVISSTGFVVNGIPNNAIGALKFSTDGTKLAAVHSFQNDCVELMDFDNTTGVISNPVIFKPNAIQSTLTGIYGAEFSPNSRLLYISSNNSPTDPSTLYQFDITSMNAATILSTKQVIAQTYPWFGGALQTGPDRKIYYSMWQDTSISVIDNPDVYGPGCNFQYNKIFLSKVITEPSQFGLPGMIASDLDPQNAPYDFIRIGGDCRNYDVSFQINRTSGINTVSWDFGDSQTSAALSPTHHYDLPGNYTVTLTINSTNCGSTLTETIKHDLFLVSPTGDFMPSDTSLCEVKNYSIAPQVTAQQYQWNTGETSPSISVSNPGLYWLEINNSGCISRDSMTISLKPMQSVYLGNDTTVCVNKPVTLNAGVNAVQYLWNTGETTKTIHVNSPGTYWVEISSNNTCSASDTLTVQWGDCDLYIPSAFSPNGDGVNDKFGLVQGINTQYYRMRIYNRFGQIIFTSSDQFKKWDGQYKNKPMPIGLYPWILVYANKNGYVQTEKGTVLLIR